MRDRAGTRSTRRLAGTAVLALMAAGAGAGCGGGRDHAAGAEAPPVPALLMTVERGDTPTRFEAGGVVRAQTTAVMTSRIVAAVLEVRVAAGDRVRAGQVLLRLDDRDLAAQVRRASSGRQAAEQGRRAAGSDREGAAAALALARATHQRMAALHGRTSATDHELDGAVAQLRAAEANLAAAEARAAQAEASLAAAGAGADVARVGASWAVITAPFDGTVAETMVEAGNMAAPGTPLLRLEKAGGLRLDVRLDESRAAVVRTGDDVEVQFDGALARSGDPVPAARAAAVDGEPGIVIGRVIEVARAPEAGSHAFLLKIALPSDLAVHSGAFARARFAGPPASGLTVPGTSVRRQGQLTSVYVLQEDRARLRLVSLGAAHGDRFEVLAGLDEGERILREPPAGISDGVRIAPGGAQ